MTRTAASLMIVALLAGCSTLPRDGPSGPAVRDGASTATRAGSYAMIDLTFEVSERLRIAPAQTLVGLMNASSNEPTDIIGIGDVLTISIFAPGSPLFAMGDSGPVLPPLVVDRNGAVSIPYAGSVNVQGMTPGAAAAAVRRALAGKVANPQVIVTQTSATSNAVTILGDVRNPGRQALNPNHDHLLDIIAAAGGTSRSVHDIDVVIIRGNQTFSAPMALVTTKFDENIRLQRGDQINLAYKPRRFSSFGAFNAVARADIPPGPLTLTEALSGVGGLNSNLANAQSVLVFRFERPEVARMLGVDQAETPRGVPVVYRLNLREGSGFFIASNFQIRPDDVIYAPHASAAEMRKFFEFVQSITRVVYDVSVTSTLN